VSTLPQTGGSMTDEQLMLKFGKGDQVAFEELFARHRQRVYAIDDEFPAANVPRS
jgi:hypothetical protein